MTVSMMAMRMMMLMVMMVVLVSTTLTTAFITSKLRPIVMIPRHSSIVSNRHSSSLSFDMTTPSQLLPHDMRTLQLQIPVLQQSVYYPPASEHTQPGWWNGGSPDPYLTLGKSIVPSTKSLSDMGITTINDTSKVVAKFGTQITNDHKFIIDATHIHKEDVLPGFTKTGSILSQHISWDASAAASPPPSVVSFVASIDWASHFINVIDRLPLAVLVYVLIEFFILRPNINTYKEEIEDNPTGIFADTMAVATVRVTMFCMVAIATVGVFG